MNNNPFEQRTEFDGKEVSDLTGMDIKVSDLIGRNVFLIEKLIAEVDELNKHGLQRLIKAYAMYPATDTALMNEKEAQLFDMLTEISTNRIKIWAHTEIEKQGAK